MSELLGDPPAPSFRSAKGPLPPIDTEEGAGFLPRALESIKISPQGKINFIKQFFGEENVVQDPKGDVFIFDQGRNKFTRFDEIGLSFKDVTADFAGEALQMIPFVRGASTVMRAATAGAAGSVARQVVSEGIPGDEQMGLGERTAEVGIDALLGGATQGGVNFASMVFDMVRPGNLVSRQAIKHADQPFAKKGRKLEEQTGIPLTFGEMTGSPAALMFEALARRTPGAADIFFEFGQKQLSTAVRNLRGILDDLDGRRLGDIEVGEKVKGAFDQVLDTARSLRSEQARIDFGRVNQLSGGQRVIPSDQVVGEIQKIIKEFDVPGAGDATQALVQRARRLEATLLNDNGAPTLLSGQMAQRLLQVYTALQSGTGNLLKDLDKAQSRMLAGRLKDALLRSIDEAAESGAAGEEVASAIRIARENYRVNSGQINELADSALSRILGTRGVSPEVIVEKIGRMNPSELAATQAILQRSNFGAYEAIKRSLVERAVVNAVPAPTQASARGIKFSAAKFLTALPDNARLRAAGFSREELVEVKRVAKVLERVSDKAFEGSPTGPFQIAFDIARGLFTLNPVTFGRTAAAVLTPRMIAKATLTPQGRDALLTLSKTSAPTKATFGAFAYLTGLVARENDPDATGLPTIDRE